ncbi:discoidin domain-containing protein [Bordetella sp. BOR01]|uniref:discoidin domain-containing protein n=1 Tax=Bordetella sp. BOR01 TaxID=2854779 RepID=UPI001C48C26C|nr:discoidin domain-containing protein [Bordetella sp. BOR01]MBV7482529.1 discoidin domain-containing protein [Bordetella sp. BOR01]
MSIIVVSPSLVEMGTGCWHSSLRHSRIGWRTLTRDAEITASSEADSWPAAALANPMTYERWKPEAVPAWVQFDAGQAVEVDYLGIASHDLGSAGATFSIQCSDDGAAWETAATVEPADDNAIMLLIEPVTARYWRLNVTEAIGSIGVLYLGKVLETYRPVSPGHSPGNLSRRTEIMPNLSMGGQFLGRSIIRQGYATAYEWAHLPAQWYRDNFAPFVEAARKYPFFIAWNPLRYPAEVLYAWTPAEDIQPENMGVRDWMQVGLKVEAIA